MRLQKQKFKEVKSEKHICIFVQYSSCLDTRTTIIVQLVSKIPSETRINRQFNEMEIDKEFWEEFINPLRARFDYINMFAIYCFTAMYQNFIAV